MKEDQPIECAWDFPDRRFRVPLFGFLNWKIGKGWGPEFGKVVMMKARRVVGFQWRDRVFIGVIIGGSNPGQMTDKPE